MVAQIYWHHHRAFDSIVAAILTIVLWYLPVHFDIILFSYDPVYIQNLASQWLGAVTTLFGLYTATVAFLFTVVDSKEFTPLSKSKSKHQFWQIFSFGMHILLLGSGWCAIAGTLSRGMVDSWLIRISGTYLMILSAICLVKFTWAIQNIMTIKSSN